MVKKFAMRVFNCGDCGRERKPLKALISYFSTKKGREEKKAKKKYVLNKPLMVMAVNKKQKALIWLENS